MKRFKDLKKRNEGYKIQYELLKKYMDSTYPGWKKDKKNAERIKKAAHELVSNYLNNVKKKKIKKSDYKGDWPFTTDEVIICKYGKLAKNSFITCFIGKKEYALTGKAQQVWTWLKFPHDAKKAIIGKDVGPFIQIGKEL